MKIRTLSQLQDALDRDISWRLKEIADLKLSVRSANSLSQSTLIRAGVPLLYAHWEGFVKNSTKSYILFVEGQRLKYEELASSFVVFGAKKHIRSLTESSRTSVNIAAVEFFLVKMSERANFSSDLLVNTKANLNSEVFENIILSVGIDPQPYQAKYNLIDASLLNHRNKIAHGENLELDPESYRKLADEVIILIRGLKTDIENAACTGVYRRQIKTKQA